jgi:hypothetical protein
VKMNAAMAAIAPVTDILKIRPEPKNFKGKRKAIRKQREARG